MKKIRTKEIIFLLIPILLGISLVSIVMMSPVMAEADSTVLKVGSDQEYRSIENAIEEANSGDTIIVHEGTYDNSIEDFPIRIEKDDLTIRSKNGPTNTGVGPTNYTAKCGPIFQIMGDNVVLKGFKVENTAWQGIWVRENSQGSKVANNIVVNNDIGIASRENTNNILIENNVVCYNRKGIAFGGGSNQKCLRNRVYNNWEKGIQLQDVENCLAKSNVVTETGFMGVLVGDDGYSADPPYTPIGKEDVTIRDSFVSPLWVFGVKRLKLINSRVKDIRGCMEIGPEGNGLIVFENTVVNGLIRLTVSGKRYKIKGDVEINGSKNLDEISWGACKREPKSLVERGGKIIRSYPAIVKDRSGNPVSDVTVSLLDKENRKVWSGETDENGRITFDIAFDENNYQESWTLRTITSDGMVLKKKVNLLSDTPVNLSPIPEFSVVNIGVKPREIEAGERVEIFIDVRNTGLIEVQKIRLPVKGIPELTKDKMETWVHPRSVSISENGETATIKIENASLNPGEKKAISISTSFENTGAHKLTAGDLSKTIQIGKTLQQISIPSVDIVENENVSIDITLRSAPKGLFDFKIAIRLENASIAKILKVNPPNWAELENRHPHGVMNGTACIGGTDLKRKIKPGMENIALGSLLLKGVEHGNTKLTADIYQMSDDGGYSIMPEVKPGSVKVKPPTTEFSVSDLSLSKSKVEPGETTTVSVIVKNVGETEGSKTVEVKIDGRIENEKTIPLSPGESKTVEFPISKKKEGTYEVTVGEMSKSFEVKKVEKQAEFEVSNLSLAKTEIKPGEKTSISVKVTNAGGKEGTYDAKISIDGKIKTQSVSLSPGASQTVTFTVTMGKKGTYEVTIEDMTKKLEVKKEAVKTAKFEVSNLNLSKEEVKKGETTTISVKVTNTGGKKGTSTAKLSVDGEVKTQSVTLRPDESEKVTFQVSREKAGTYKIKVGELSKTLNVRKPEKAGKGLPWALISGIIAAVVVISAFVLYKRK